MKIFRLLFLLFIENYLFGEREYNNLCIRKNKRMQNSLDNKILEIEEVEETIFSQNPRSPPTVTSSHIVVVIFFRFAPPVSRSIVSPNKSSSS